MSGVTADVVHSIFEHTRLSLPEHVPAMPSIVLGLSVTISVSVIGMVIALIDKSKTEKSERAVDRLRWIAIGVAAVTIGLFVGDYAQGKDYTIKCITANRQHYANVHWLRLYMRAIRGQYPNA